MAEATVTNTSYGYRITGGVDSTLVTSQKIIVKLMTLFPKAGADTATLKDNASNAIAIIKGDATADVQTEMWFDGARLDGLRVTLANADDILLIFVA